MSPRRTLVDTSAWIETLREAGSAELRADVAALTAEGLAVVCDMILLELWNGARSSDDRRTLQHLERELECVATTAAVWSLSRDLARALRTSGLTLPATDLLIAACAEHYGLELLHRDAHFEQLLRRRRKKS